MGMSAEGGKFELVGRLQDVLEQRQPRATATPMYDGEEYIGDDARHDAAHYGQQAQPRRQQQQSPRRQPPPQRQSPQRQPQRQQRQAAQPIEVETPQEEGYVGDMKQGIFSAMAQQRVEQRPDHPDGAPPPAKFEVPASLSPKRQRRPAQQVTHDHLLTVLARAACSHRCPAVLQNPAGSYAEPWDDVQGDARRQQRQQQPSPQRGGVDGGFFAGREVQPSPPVGPRPTEQRTPRSYGGGSQRSPGRGGTGMNLEDEMERVAAEKSQVSPNRLDHVHFARLRTAISRCAAL